MNEDGTCPNCGAQMVAEWGEDRVINLLCPVCGWKEVCP